MKKPLFILLVLLSLNGFAQLPSNLQNFVEKYYNAHVAEDIDYLRSVFPEDNIGWYGYHGIIRHGYFPYFSGRSKKDVIKRRIKKFEKEDWTATRISGVKVLKQDKSSSILITYTLHYRKVMIKDRKSKSGDVQEWMMINSNGKITNIHDKDISEYYAQLIKDKAYQAKRKEKEEDKDEDEKIVPTKYEGLLQLAELKKEGLLSEEEFEIEKSKILGSNDNAKTNIIKSSNTSSLVDKNIPINSKVENRFALVIGNEDYTSSQRTLSSEQNVDYAVNDATIFKQYCLNTLGVKEGNMSFFPDATAGTMHQAIDLITKILNKVGAKAELIVYYAGHGYPDELTKVPYLIPVDVSAANLSTAIKLDDLYQKLANTNASKITMFLDACFTGGGRNSGLVASRGVKVKPKQGTLNGNMVVFSASSEEQSSLPYHDERHGIFTYFLLKKFQETKGNVTLGELSEYLDENVSIQSLRVNQKEQDPTVNTSSKVVNDWRNWKF